MKIGLFTATFLDMGLEDVFKLASGLGYQAVEMPAFANNPHLDIGAPPPGLSPPARRGCGLSVGVPTAAQSPAARFLS